MDQQQQQEVSVEAVETDEQQQLQQIETVVENTVPLTTEEQSCEVTGMDVEWADMDPDQGFSAPIASSNGLQSVPFRKPRTVNPGFVSGIDVLSQEEQKKREIRAAKFNIPLFQQQYNAQALAMEESSKIDKRIERFGVVAQPTLQVEQDKEESKKDVDVTVGRRPEVVHVYGTDRMSTADVLKYFDGYGPSMVEWINDSSCNVVFGDSFSAQRALVNLGTLIPAQVAEARTQLRESMGDNVDAIPLNQLELIVWRYGQNNQHDEPMLLRMATIEDVKLPPDQRKGSKWYAHMFDQLKRIQNNRARTKSRGKQAKKQTQRGRKKPNTKKKQTNNKQENNNNDNQADKENAMDTSDGKVRTRGKRGGRRHRRKNTKPYDRTDADMQAAESTGDNNAPIIDTTINTTVTTAAESSLSTTANTTTTNNNNIADTSSASLLNISQSHIDPSVLNSSFDANLLNSSFTSVALEQDPTTDA